MTKVSSHQRADRIRFDFSSAGKTADKINIVDETLRVPLNRYEQFIPIIEGLLTQIPRSTFKANLSHDYWDFEDFDIAVCDDIGTNSLDVLFENPTLDLKELLRVLPLLFQNNLDIFQKIQDSYPCQPAHLMLESNWKEELRASVAALCSLIRSNAKNASFLPWLAHNAIPYDCRTPICNEHPQVKKCGVFEKYKAAISSHEQYWVILSPQNEVQIINANGEIDIQFKVDHLDKSGSGNSIRLWKDPKTLGIRLVKVYDELVTNWCSEEIPLPCYFPYSIENRMIPDQIVLAFKDLILSTDTIVMRAMLHHDVFPVEGNGAKMIESLFTIFSSKGLVHRFLSTVISQEFSHPGDLTETMVLRGNSHLTCLFKFFAAKYGKDYFRNVIKPLIQEISKRGDVGIKKPEDPAQYDAAQDKVREILNIGIDKAISSAQYIPLQFRHIASILKAMTSIVLRTKHAVFNALSSFMLLRFFTPAIVSPQKIDPSEVPPANQKDTTIPYSSLIQLPFNLQPFQPEKYPHLLKLNEEIINRYADIYNFALEIAEYNKPAEYEVASTEEANKATKWILLEISKEPSQRKEFIKRVKDLSEQEEEKSAVSFMFANILAQCFD